MKNTLENLRERSPQEKRAIAGWVSIGVVILLFLVWTLYFFHSIMTTPAPNAQNSTGTVNGSGLQQAQAAFSANEQQVEQVYGSTTQFIESGQGQIELEEIGTTSTQSSQ